VVAAHKEAMAEYTQNASLPAESPAKEKAFRKEKLTPEPKTLMIKTVYVEAFERESLTS